MKLIDADARVTVQSFDVEHEEYNYTEMSVAEALDFATDEGCPPAVDAAPVVRCRECKHKKLDGPSICKSIVNEFYCDEKLGWRYQYEGEPDILDWFCADGERADAKMDGGETDGKS